MARKQLSEISLLILFLFITNNLFAQLGYGKPEDIKAVKARPLIVVQLEPNEKLLKKYQKKGLAKKYVTIWHEFECI